MSNMLRIGLKIKNIREWRNYTQTFMAAQLGVKQNTYSFWEQGKGLTGERVDTIARVLDVPPDELGSPDPVSLSLTNNNGNNGYVSIQNQQQHTVPLDVVERLLGESRERTRILEDLMKAQLELLNELVLKLRSE